MQQNFLPPLNKAPRGVDNLKHFITCAEYLCKPGSLNIVLDTPPSPALVTLAWLMLHWSFIKASWAAFMLELNNLSGAPDYRLEAAVCETTDHHGCSCWAGGSQAHCGYSNHNQDSQHRGACAAATHKLGAWVSQWLAHKFGVHPLFPVYLNTFCYGCVPAEG